MTSPPAPPDWSAARYERTAEQLLPAARAVVEHAVITPGERLIDVGCGTGNAALLAAERGARATGVDPAARLLDVAREQAAARGLDATFVSGDAAKLPVADGEADVVVSVFGVIFAPAAGAAARELARVTRPGGRLALSAWIPQGAIGDSVRAAREAVARALGAPPGAPPFAWHERGALARLLEPAGFTDLARHDERLAFTDRSPAAFADAELEHHPLSRATRDVLGPRGELAALRDRQVEILAAANEDPAAFRVTSRYVVATARRR
jgi:SAM-dependent methyltransferase